MGMNWFALIASIFMFATVVSSLFSPWWKMQVGSDIVTVNADPFFTSFNILGVSYIVPIIFALNVGTAALFIASGIALIVYTVKPAESYSKYLLSFGWKRPLHVIVGFICILVLSLYAMSIAVNAIAPDITAPTPIAPLVGSSTIRLSSSILNIHAEVAITTTTTFTHSFFLGVAAAALSIAARMYHHRMLSAGNAEKA